MGSISLNGVFVPAQFWKEVRQWSAEGSPAGRPGPRAARHSPASLWTRYKKSLMGRCGESCWKPALFYFCKVFLLQLILWKKAVSGFVCLYGPSVLLPRARLPESARKCCQTRAASWVLTLLTSSLSRFT